MKIARKSGSKTLKRKRKKRVIAQDFCIILYLCTTADEEITWAEVLFCLGAEIIQANTPHKSKTVILGSEMFPFVVCLFVRLYDWNYCLGL